jgi:hypothetical protein
VNKERKLMKNVLYTMANEFFPMGIIDGRLPTMEVDNIGGAGEDTESETKKCGEGAERGWMLATQPDHSLLPSTSPFFTRIVNAKSCIKSP